MSSCTVIKSDHPENEASDAKESVGLMVWLERAETDLVFSVFSPKAIRNSGFATSKAVNLCRDHALDTVMFGIRHNIPSGVFLFAHGTSGIEIQEKHQQFETIAVFSGNVDTSFVPLVLGGKGGTKVAEEMYNKIIQRKCVVWLTRKYRC